MKSEVEKAYIIAKKAHREQKDKGGSPYINHPVAVAEMVESDNEKAVAFLHDVVEDTDITLENLADEGFSEAVVSGVDAMTRREGEAREDYILRLSRNPVAVRVKIADLTHNSDLSRIPEPEERDRLRVKKYKKELEFLKGKCVSKTKG